MESVKTVHDMFYFVEDIMRLLGYSKSKCYKIIAKLNGELEATGIYTCPGRVSKKYFEQRYGLDGAATAQKGRRASA